MDRKIKSLGTSSKNAAHVFVASDRPAVIYSSNKKLLYRNVNLRRLKEVSLMCPFNFGAFPDSLAITNGRKLTIGTMDDIKKLHIHSIQLQEHVQCICHQELTGTFAICSWKFTSSSAKEVESQFIHSLDDQTFKIFSTCSLDEFECDFSILSCSFSDDNNVYYCVGTGYRKPKNQDITKGRILVFAVKDKQVDPLIKKTMGSVNNLSVWNGRLLAAVNDKIEFYKWMLRDDGLFKLKLENEFFIGIGDLLVQTRGDAILVGDITDSFTMLSYEQLKGKIKVLAYDEFGDNLTAIEILEGDVYLGAEKNCNIFTVPYRNKKMLEVVGKFHLGELVH